MKEEKEFKLCRGQKKLLSKEEKKSELRRMQIDHLLIKFGLTGIDFELEHQRIQRKESTLSANQRRAVLQILELAKKITESEVVE